MAVVRKRSEARAGVGSQEQNHVESLRQPTLTPSPFDDTLLELYEPDSHIPKALATFPDSERRSAFVALATAQSATAGKREPKQAAPVEPLASAEKK